MLLSQSLFFLCLAQIIHFTSHWVRLTRSILEDWRTRRLRSHLNWNGPQHRPRV